MKERAEELVSLIDEYTRNSKKDIRVIDSWLDRAFSDIMDEVIEHEGEGNSD